MQPKKVIEIMYKKFMNTKTAKISDSVLKKVSPRDLYKMTFGTASPLFSLLHFAKGDKSCASRILDRLSMGSEAFAFIDRNPFFLLKVDK